MKTAIKVLLFLCWICTFFTVLTGAWAIAYTFYSIGNGLPFSFTPALCLAISAITTAACFIAYRIVKQ